jgi:DNA-binding CsgD family transcriptional regulator
MQPSPCCSDGVSLGPGSLSPEARDVLQLAATGLLSDQVAERLGMSSDEVRGHTARAAAALRAGSRLEAVLLALKLGLINLPNR